VPVRREGTNEECGPSAFDFDSEWFHLPGLSSSRSCFGPESSVCPVFTLIGSAALSGRKEAGRGRQGTREEEEEERAHHDAPPPVTLIHGARC
jgi:hypothetical protein